MHIVFCRSDAKMLSGKTQFREIRESYGKRNLHYDRDVMVLKLLAVFVTVRPAAP